jgi:hypothetical protein
MQFASMVARSIVQYIKNHVCSVVHLNNSKNSCDAVDHNHLFATCLNIRSCVPSGTCCDCRPYWALFEASVISWMTQVDRGWQIASTDCRVGSARAAFLDLLS